MHQWLCRRRGLVAENTGYKMRGDAFLIGTSVADHAFLVSATNREDGVNTEQSRSVET